MSSEGGIGNGYFSRKEAKGNQKGIKKEKKRKKKKNNNEYKSSSL
jgi:hypothetical protein